MSSAADQTTFEEGSPLHGKMPESSTSMANGKQLSLSQFQNLVGTIRTATKSTTAPRKRSWSSIWLLKGTDPRDPMAMYPKVLKEEKSALHQLYMFEALVYSCLIAQLAIASALVILSAIGGDHHVVVAILGAVTALIAGILSLVKGQGQPVRLLNYADSLRQVRDDIEFFECGLKAEIMSVTYGQVLSLWERYNTTRDNQMRNRPDVWTSQGNVLGRE
ncbi:hypothetical protein BDV29DRAFT_196448 [Aspergillus leporis]|uniref:SMODS and SLOG-associating 2TM effector domain-containing protein n=1 Tax=Aspergillus leporis TaxID=41062 RepID=A0A5N5WJH1_9EURO|nr:hypothetical protein BDV29DRAFT_196448 [Aspergillus leporis]